MMALAKLHARTAYRPQTPRRKSSGGSTNDTSPVTPYRKDSISSSCCLPKFIANGSNSPPSTTSLSTIKKFRDRRSSGVSSLNEYQRMNETQDQMIKGCCIKIASDKGLKLKEEALNAPAKSAVRRQ